MWTYSYYSSSAIFPMKPWLTNHFACLILDNIWILLLKNTLADTSVQEIYPIVNPWNLYNNTSTGYYYHCKCANTNIQVKFYAKVSKNTIHTMIWFFLLQYSIFQSIFCSILFSNLCAIYIFLNIIVPFLIFMISSKISFCNVQSYLQYQKLLLKFPWIVLQN